MATDTALQVQALANLAFPGSDSTTSAIAVASQNLVQRHITRLAAADVTASSTGIYRLMKFDRAATVLSATVTEEAAVASNTSNYLTWTLIQDNDAASATTTVSTTAGLNTSGSAFVAQSSQSMPMNATAANLNIAAGGALYAQLAKAGAGVSRTAPAVIDVIFAFTGP